MRTIQWIPTWQGLDGFQKCLRPCALEESSPSIGRVKRMRRFTSHFLILFRHFLRRLMRCPGNWVLEIEAGRIECESLHHLKVRASDGSPWQMNIWVGIWSSFKPDLELFAFRRGWLQIMFYSSSSGCFHNMTGRARDRYDRCDKSSLAQLLTYYTMCGVLFSVISLRLKDPS